METHMPRATTSFMRISSAIHKLPQGKSVRVIVHRESRLCRWLKKDIVVVGNHAFIVQKYLVPKTFLKVLHKVEANVEKFYWRWLTF
jgi:hypothetical protein